MEEPRGRPGYAREGREVLVAIGGCGGEERGEDGFCAGCLDDARDLKEYISKLLLVSLRNGSYTPDLVLIAGILLFQPYAFLTSPSCTSQMRKSTIICHFTPSSNIIPPAGRLEAMFSAGGRLYSCTQTPGRLWRYRVMKFQISLLVVYETRA